MTLDKEFVDKVEEHMLRYAGTTKLRNVSAQHVLDYLRFKLKPEYPCPVCGEEMEIISKWHDEHSYSAYCDSYSAYCDNGHVRIHTSIYDSRRLLKEALNG